MILARSSRAARVLWTAVAVVACAKDVPPELALPVPDGVAVEPDGGDAVAVAAVAASAAPATPSPYAAWLGAHATMGEPPERAGGPLAIELSHAGGGLYVFRPDAGATDPHAPSSDRFFTLYDARVRASIVDRTPFDAATSEDSVQLEATWRDGGGTVYGVRCCTELGGADRRHPTFGGVLTNHLVHGATGIGSAHLPTAWAWVAVWGVGDLLRNGAVIESGVPVQVLVTERTRDDDLHRVADGAVDGTQRQMEILVEPLRRGEAGWTPTPLDTGYATAEGPMPYWHVLFPHFKLRWDEGG